MEQGLRVVIDDYVRNDVMRTTMLLLNRGVCAINSASFA